MKWNKKPLGTMRWFADLIDDDAKIVTAKLEALVADGYFVHTIAPRDYHDGSSDIQIFYSKRERVAKKPKAEKATDVA